jgi:hypothetical protein
MLNVVVIVILSWLMYRMGGRANIGNGKKNYLGVLHGSKTVRIGWVSFRQPNLQIGDRNYRVGSVNIGLGVKGVGSEIFGSSLGSICLREDLSGGLIDFAIERQGNKAAPGPSSS